MMRAALALARRSLGRTWPNPAVGCVIVRDGEVIAAAEPEAETTVVDLMAALKASVEKAKKSGQTAARGTRGGHESLVHKKAASTTKEKRRKAS